jgi:hypothetical protein
MNVMTFTRSYEQYIHRSIPPLHGDVAFVHEWGIIWLLMMMSASISVSDLPKQHCHVFVSWGICTPSSEQKKVKKSTWISLVKKALFELLVYIYNADGKGKTPRLLGQIKWSLAVT